MSFVPEGYEKVGIFRKVKEKISRALDIFVAVVEEMMKNEV